ncbi:MAG TPA: hypothetical protein VN660_03285 [Steroidobacteraceae bacterium]|nr:hypothetical protein [Steroidobacteraceae bacterium]
MIDVVSAAIGGDVGGMDADHRLLIPVRVREALEWLPKTKRAKPFELVADLRDSGLVRLYPAEQVRPLLLSMRQQLLVGHPDPLQAAAAFADRYREVTYYATDTRVHCGAAMGWHLRGTSQHPDQFYVEALGQFIDVMTLERRNARQADLRAALDLSDD